MVYTIFFALVISIPLGIAMAYRANTMVDRSLSTGAFGLLSVPNYIMGVLLVYLFAFQLDWLPATSDYVPLATDPVEHFRALALPVLTLTLGLLAVFTRLLRSDMIATLQSDFITMARAKGMPTRRDPVPPRPAPVALLPHHRGRAASRRAHRRHHHRRADLRPPRHGRRSRWRPSSGATS